MFRRNITDKTGLEPSQLFAVVQFLMCGARRGGRGAGARGQPASRPPHAPPPLPPRYDKAFAGFVTLDQTMHMLFSRYGKDRLETEMKALFGDSIVEDGNSKLNFLEYLSRVKERAKVLAAAAAEEQKAKYSGAPGLKKKG